MQPTIPLTSSGCDIAVLAHSQPLFGQPYLQRELRVAGIVYGCDVEANLLTGQEVANRTVQAEASAIFRRGSKDTHCSSSSWTTVSPGCRESAFRSKAMMKSVMMT
jgi:hypothetical protein